MATQSVEHFVEPGQAADWAGAAMDALRRIVRSLRVADRDSQAALGLTAAQLFVLREVEKAERLTISELARHTTTAQSSVSEVLARLVSRGLALRTRSPSDGRCFDVTVSDRGRELLARTPASIQERLVRAFQRLPAARQRQTADGLQAWIAEAGLNDLPATMFFEPLGPETRGNLRAAGSDSPTSVREST
jgi:MarR family transcriptional regulator, lower aerobic nicotinate degradation pathway regulator